MRAMFGKRGEGVTYPAPERRSCKVRGVGGKRFGSTPS